MLIHGLQPLRVLTLAFSLCGTTKLKRLEENIGVAASEPTTDDLREIELVASKIDVQGARYPENLERMTGR